MISLDCMNKQEALQYHQEQKAASDRYTSHLQSSLDEAYGSALIGRSKEGLLDKYLFATVGFTHVGKTTAARGLIEKFPGLVNVESNLIHNVVNNAFPELKDDNTVTGSGYWLRNVITDEIRAEMIRNLCQDGWWIINDSSNLTSVERQSRIQVPKQFDYRTVLLWLNLPEEVILERLRAADEEAVQQGNKPAWLDLYNNVQKPRLEEPMAGETDFLLMFTKNEGIVDSTIAALGYSFIH